MPRAIKLLIAFLVAVVPLSIGAIARADPWPIAPTSSVKRLVNTYGQFQELGDLHFHEGIDIAAAAGSDAFATRAGTIVEVVTAGYSSVLTIEDLNAEHVGFGYVHVIPDPASNFGIGSQVIAGQKLGVVAAYPGGGFPDHVHYERASDANGGWPGFGGGTPHLLDNSLTYLDNFASDFVSPTTADAMLFRRAQDEGNDTTAQYMTTLSCGKKVIGSRAPNGSGNVDVIADSFDRFAGFADRLGIREIRIDAQGRPTVGNDQIPANQTLVNFSGDAFLPNNNNFADFRSVALTQVIYEHDNVAGSRQFGPFYHILTNQGAMGAQIVAGDAAYFWDTDGTRGQPWNDNNAADRAPNNAKSAFRDDIYTVFARAFDTPSNVGTGVDMVILDNWLQTVTPDMAMYDLGDTVAAANGEQFLPSDSVPLFVLQNLPAACDPIASGGILASVPSNLTDLDGILSFSDVWTASMIGNFVLFADYDHDGMFIPELDAHAPFAVVPEPALGVAIAIAALPALRRRRR